MPVLVVGLFRAIIILAVQFGITGLIEKYLGPQIDKAVAAIAKRFGLSDEEAKDVAANQYLQMAESFAINVAVLKTRTPLKVADKLGFKEKGWGKRAISSKALLATIPKTSFGTTFVSKIVNTQTQSGQAAASMLGVSWNAIKAVGNFIGKGLGLTFLGVIAINNAIDFGNWESGAYSDTFQKIFEKVTGGLLVPDEPSNSSQVLTKDMFEKIYNAYLIQGAMGITDPRTGERLAFTKSNVAGIIDWVASSIILDKGTVTAKEVVKNTQLLMHFGPPPGFVGPVLPTPARPSVAGGSVSGVSPQVLTGLLIGGVLGEPTGFTEQPASHISSIQELKQSAENNLAAFLKSLAGRLIYELKLVSSIVNRDGVRLTGSKQQILSRYKEDGTPIYKTVINRFGVLDIYFFTRKGARQKLDSINLGPTDAQKLAPGSASLTQLTANLKENISTSDIGQIKGIVTNTPLSLIPPTAVEKPGNNISDRYALVDGKTVYYKATARGFATPAEFFAHSGLTSFDGLIFDTTWMPGSAATPAPSAVQRMVTIPVPGRGVVAVTEAEAKEALATWERFAAQGNNQFQGVDTKAAADQTRSILNSLAPTTAQAATPVPTVPISTAPPGFVGPVLPGTTATAPTPTSKPPIPAGLFAHGEPYKFGTNPTVYIYESNHLRGVATPQAFARYYGRTWDGRSDLNTIRQIRAMPDLAPYSVPVDFFDGAVIN